MTVQNTVECPKCGSQRVWKDGIRYTRFREVQRYICRECSYRFSCKEHIVSRKLPFFSVFDIVHTNSDRKINEILEMTL